MHLSHHGRVSRIGWAVAIAIVLACLPALGGAAQVRITYSVATRGEIQTDPSDFAALVAEIYADPRGWSRGGGVRFDRVPDGGAFTLWLAAADRMRTFGEGCSTAWSCRVGRNVVINEERWRLGSPFWAGVLDDYRAMLLNHETGHWIGLGHTSCEGPDRAAPVMMQQSMGTGACRANPWPLPEELMAAARVVGASVALEESVAEPGAGRLRPVP